jgi:hypothetical protein
MKNKRDLALENQAQGVELSFAEVIAALFAILPAMILVTVYAVDAAGWRIDPIAILVVLTIEATCLTGWVWRNLRRFSIHFDSFETTGFIVVFVGFFGYLSWLARPSYLPLTQFGELVHHLSLIDFIQDRHSLVHDPSLATYLGEMVNHPPDSHILAALPSDWLGTRGIRVLYPLVTLFVAIKAGIAYNLILRLLPPQRRNLAVALAGALFLLVPYGYFLFSFVERGFYAQVVSETFVVAMAWVLVTWEKFPSPILLAVFALCGIAVWLSFPLWLPIPLAALTALLIIRRDLSLQSKIHQFTFTIAPIGVIIATYAIGRLDSAQEILMAQGETLAPSVEVYGRPFLALVILGIVINLWTRRLLALLFFACAAVAQTAALFVFDTYYHVTSFYLVYKMFYLLSTL